MRWASLFILLFCLSGCGYHLPGQADGLPGGVEKLYIQLFVNTTAEPRLETRMTSQVSQVFSRNKNIDQVEKQKNAEAVLEGTIRDYQNKSLSYNKNDDIGTYLSRLTIDAVLRQVETNQVLWKGTVKWREQYSASNDKNIQELARQQALQQMIFRLSEDLFYRLLDDF